MVLNSKLTATLVCFISSFITVMLQQGHVLHLRSFSITTVSFFLLPSSQNRLKPSWFPMAVQRVTVNPGPLGTLFSFASFRWASINNASFSPFIAIISSDLRPPALNYSYRPMKRQQRGPLRGKWASNVQRCSQQRKC